MSKAWPDQAPLQEDGYWEGTQLLGPRPRDCQNRNRGTAIWVAHGLGCSIAKVVDNLLLLTHP